MKDPLFSLIIPAYNCEDFLAEAIESVILQDIGFSDSVQLVIVDDGSEDNTACIARAYAEQLPDNIMFVQQANAGASAARLRGLELARGAYINFLDADDKWSLDALSCAATFFRKHPDVGVVAARHLYFGAKEGRHPLDYKFEQDAVVDLLLTDDYPQLSLNNVFIHRDLLKADFFDNRLRFSEDFLVVNLVLLQQMRYGVMARPTYWYRKREGGGSAIDASVEDVAWYQDTPRYCYQRLFDESMRRFGRILPHLQFLVMYDLQWRVKNPLPHPLDVGQLEAYRGMIVDLLQKIDDSVIARQRHLTIHQKAVTLGLKYGISVREVLGALRFDAGACCWKAPDGRSHVLGKLAAVTEVQIDFIKPSGNSLVFEGCIHGPFLVGGVGLTASFGGETVESTISERPDQRIDSFFDRGCCYRLGFVLELPCDKHFGCVEFSLRVGGQALRPSFKSGKFCPITFRPFEWVVFGDFVLQTVLRDRWRFALVRRNVAKLLVREVLNELSYAIARPAKRGALKYRRIGALDTLFDRQPKERIWLISDRTTMAGDNGEALFRHLVEHPIDGVQPYFVLNEDSPDFQRMQEVGPVVPFDSPEHKRLHMRADKVISSAADEYVFNRFGKSRGVVKAFEHYDFVFLQHGITQNDLSAWLNRWKKNISVFITAARAEYDSIISTPAYGYGPDQVRLTGFPRHDKLLRMDAEIPTEKIVLVAPTWREFLTLEADPLTGKRATNPRFEASEYFEFYSRLINDSSLKEALDRNGWALRFLIHPALEQEAGKFKSSFAEVVTSYDYPLEFTRSAIMLTDYSSVSFDFALLGKPVVYAQFDAEEFLAKHPWGKGYFDARRDGFGPVCETYQETIEAIVALIQGDREDGVYLQRSRGFFFSPSRPKCEGVVEAIMGFSATSPGNAGISIIE